MLVENDWFIFNVHLTTPRLSMAVTIVCVQMIIDDGHLEKKYVEVDSHKWIVSDQWSRWIDVWEDSHDRCRLVYFSICTNTTLNSWRSMMALHHHFSSSHVDDDDVVDDDDDGDQHYSYILHVYRWHAHISHVSFSTYTVWVSCNSWNLNICVKLCSQSSWLPLSLSLCLITSSINLSISSFFQKNHREYPAILKESESCV
jgi:hypothetical protein